MLWPDEAMPLTRDRSSFCSSPPAIFSVTPAALSSAILPFVLSLASGPLDEVLAGDPGLAAGLVLRRGEVTHRGIAEGAGLPFRGLGDSPSASSLSFARAKDSEGQSP